MASVSGDGAVERAALRVRELGLLRQAALERARGYRSSGQLVPGSLREEIAENGEQLRQAVDVYTQTKLGA